MTGILPARCAEPRSDLSINQSIKDDFYYKIHSLGSIGSLQLYNTSLKHIFLVSTNTQQIIIEKEDFRDLLLVYDNHKLDPDLVVTGRIETKGTESLF